MPISKPAVGSAGWNTAVDALIDRHNVLESFDPAAVQPADADLTALAGLGDGSPRRSGGTWSVRSDAQLAAALGVSSGGAASNDVGPLEGMTAYSYGHSYNNATYNTGIGAAGSWIMRLADRKRMTLVGRAQDGLRMIATGDSVARRVLSGGQVWTPNTRGLITLCCTYNDAASYGTDAASVRSFGHAVRTFLAATRSKAKITAASAAWVYSAGWTSSATSAITSTNRIQTTTVGAYAEVNVVGDKADLLLTLRAAGNGVYTITSGGSTVATVSTMNTTMGIDYTPAAISLSGLGSGTHTLRITLTSGTWLGVDGLFIPSETPPPVILLGEGTITGASAGIGATIRATYLPVMSSVAAEFPNAVYVDSDDASWSSTTMAIFDGVHPNDHGASVLATLVLNTIATDVDWSNGLNTIAGTSPSYSAPAAPSTPGGGQNGAGVAGAATVASATDNFTRTDSASVPGGTETGALTWAVTGGVGATWGITSNRLRNKATADSVCTIDPGLASGTVSLTLPGAALNRGIAFRISTDGVEGFVFWRNASGTYELAAKGTGGYFPVGSTFSGVTPGSDDVLTVVMNGSAITCRVNGTTVITHTEASFAVGNTRHGAFSFTANDDFDAFTWSDSTSIGGGTLTNSTLPTITGTATEGQTLTAGNGTWSATPDSHTYQWKRAGTNISGATSSTYVLVTADVGSTITVAVTAVKSGYTSATATSAATGTVAALGGATTIAADTFTRANGSTLGSTETGSFAWTPNAGTTWAIASNALTCTSSAGDFSVCAADTGAADGTVSITMATSGTAGGLAFRFNTDGSNGYIVWKEGSNYTLSRKTSSSYNGLGSSSGITPASGDVLTAVLNGSSITIKVNGTTRIGPVTTSTYATQTRHGGVSFGGDVFDAFTQTNATT